MAAESAEVWAVRRSGGRAASVRRANAVAGRLARISPPVSKGKFVDSLTYAGGLRKFLATDRPTALPLDRRHHRIREPFGGLRMEREEELRLEHLELHQEELLPDHHAVYPGIEQLPGAQVDDPLRLLHHLRRRGRPFHRPAMLHLHPEIPSGGALPHRMR